MAWFRSGWSRQVLAASAMVGLVVALIASAWVAAPTAAQGPISGFVTRSGDRLLVNGAPYRFSGANIYNATSDGWCSFHHTDDELRDAFAAIADAADASAYPGDGAVVRTWFFQSLAASKEPGQDHRWSGGRVWDRFDRVLAIAAEEGVRVIPVLGNQWGECGDMVPDRANYRDAAWYADGYKVPDPIQLQSPPNPEGPGYLRGYDQWVSYRDWVAEVVTRYADREVILAWQLMNEAEVWYPGGCPTGTDAPMQLIKDFASDISGVIRNLDPHHLISLGTMGGGQCGAQGGQYQTLHDLPNIDVCEYHDYSPAPMPGDQWNGLAVRIAQCAALNKPLFVGEVGLWLHDVPGGTLQARAGVLRAKLDAQVSAGIVGHLAWNHNERLVGAPVGDAAFDFGPGDPMLLELARARVLPPGAPTDLFLTPGDATVCATWTPPTSDGGSPVIGYRMSATPGTSHRWTRGPSGCLAGLENGTPLDIEITPITAPGLGHDLAGPALSAQATPVDGPLSIEVQAPSLLLGGIGTTTTNTIVVVNTGPDELVDVSVTTDPPLDGMTCDVEQPGALAAGASFSCTGDHTVSAADIAAGSVIHTGCVQAAGAATTCDTVEVGLPPNPITQLAARNSWDATLVTWNPPLAERRAPVTGYTVTVWSAGPAPSGAPEPAPVAVVTVAATATRAAVEGLVVGDPYRIEVTAENGFGVSDPSTLVHGFEQVPTLTVSESPVDLGLCLPGITCGRSVTVSNAGWVAVTIGTVAVDGPAFTRRASETCTGATLAEGQSCRVDLDLLATDVGPYGAMLRIPSDAPQGLLDIPLTATVVDPDHASGTILPGQSLATRAGAVPNGEDPVTTTVTASEARFVTITETDPPPADGQFTFIGQRVTIDAPHGPLFTFVFRIHGASPDTVILRDGGDPVFDCSEPREPHMNPCVLSRVAGPGHAILTLEGSYTTGFVFARPFAVEVTTFPPNLPAIGETVLVEALVRNLGPATLEDVDVTQDLGLTGWTCDPATPVAELRAWRTIECSGTLIVTADDVTAGSIAGDVCAVTARAASFPECAVVDVATYEPGTVHLSPPWHDFGGHDLGRGTDRDLVITNDGPAPVTVLGVTWSGGPSPFYLSHTCDGATIPAGGTCVIDASFATYYLGSHRSRVDVTVDVGGSDPIVVSAFLRGMGIGSPLTPITQHADVWFQNGAFRFENVISPEIDVDVLSVEITGDDPEAWAIIGNECVGSWRNWCSITTAFTPSDETPKSATLVVTTTAGTFTSELTGQASPGSLASRIVVDGDDLVGDRIDITDVPVGDPGATELVVQSIGDIALDVDSIAFEGGDAPVFAIAEDCTSRLLGYHETCAITITATPDQPGELSSTLVIASDRIEGTVRIDVSVNRPLEPDDIVVAPSHIDYGQHPVRDADHGRRITVTNHGPVPVILDRIDGQDYGSSLSVSPWDCVGRTVPPGGACESTVWFYPRLLGAYAASPTFTVVGPNGFEVVHTVELSGEAVGSPLDHASHAFQGPGAAGIAFYNIFSESPVDVGSVHITGADAADFSINLDQCTGVAVVSTGACGFEVVFQPASDGQKAAEVVVQSSAGTYSASLTGNAPAGYHPDSVSGDPGAGGTISTGGGAAATPSDPTTVSVTTPTGGTVSIAESAVPGDPPPSGYTLFGSVAQISAPDGLPGQPLRITMRVDASIVPAGVDETNVVMFRNGVPVARCTAQGSGMADPDPCVDYAYRPGDGDLEVSALASQASEWALGEFDPDSAWGDAGPGGTIATGGGGEATGSDPMTTSVTTPSGGPVIITETPALPATETTYFVGQHVVVTAPTELQDEPLRIVLRVDGYTDALEIHADGVLVPDCATPGAGVAIPAPCLDVRSAIEDDGVITVLALAGGTFDVGFPIPVELAFALTEHASYDSVGEILDVRVDVQNRGWGPLTGVTVTSPDVTITGCVDVWGANPPGLPMSAGVTWSCRAQHVVTQANLDARSFPAEVCATSDQTGPVCQVIDFRRTAFELRSVADPASGIQGTPITLTLTIDNDSAEALTVAEINGSVNDWSEGGFSPCSALTGMVIPADDGDAEPDGPDEISCSYIDRASWASDSFSAYVIARDVDEYAYRDDVVVDVELSPAFSVDVQLGAPTFEAEGQEIAFVVTYTNITGQTLEPLQRVTDPGFGVVDFQCTPPAWVPSSEPFEPGAQVVCTGFVRITDTMMMAAAYHSGEACAYLGSTFGPQACATIDVFRTSADAVSGDVLPGGTVATSAMPTGPADPLTVAVTTPTGGLVSITEGPAGDAPPAGFRLLGAAAVISAPAASVSDPLRITMRVDGSVVPAGVDETNVVMFRNGIPVPACAAPGAGTAEPDPCIESALVLGDGDLQVTALTSHASEWGLGYAAQPGPAITIESIASGSFDAIDDDIEILVTLTNTGDVTLTNLTPRIGTDQIGCVLADGHWEDTLTPGQEVVCQEQFRVRAADLASGLITGHVCVASDELAEVCEPFEIRETPFETFISLADAQQYIGSTFEGSIVVDNDGAVPLTLAGVVRCGELEETVIAADDSSDPGGDDEAGCAWSDVPESDQEPYLTVVTAIGPDGYAYTDDAEVAFELLPIMTVEADVTPRVFEAVDDILDVAVTITNTSLATITDVAVVDPGLDGFACFPSASEATLAVSASITCSGRHRVTAVDVADGSWATDVCATSQESGEVCGQAFAASPALRVSTLPRTSFDTVGQIVRSTTTLVNTGDMTITGVEVTTSDLTDLACEDWDGNEFAVADIEPGAEVYCTTRHEVTQADLDAGFYHGSVCISSNEVGTTCHLVDLRRTPFEITYGVDDAQQRQGSTFTFTLSIENDGPEPLMITDLGVSGSENTTGEGSCQNVVGQTLAAHDAAPGGPDTFTCTYTARPQRVHDDYIATVWAEGTDGYSYRDQASVTIELLAALSASAEVVPETFRQEGDVVTASITFTNLSDGDLADVVISEPDADGWQCTPASPVALFDSGDTIVCTGTHTIDLSDMNDRYWRFGEVCATTASGAETCSGGITFLALPLEVELTADPVTIVEPGEDVTFRYVVRNPGPAQVWVKSISDDVHGPLVGSPTCSPTHPTTVGLAPGTILEAGQSCSFTATFPVTGVDGEVESTTFTAVVQEVGGGPSGTASATVTVAIVGSATEPLLDLSPAGRDFGSVEVGQSSGRSFTVTNIGDADLDVSAVELAGANPGQFSVTDEDCSGTLIAPAGTCSIEVRFEPGSTGAKTARLEVASDSDGSPHSATLDGNAYADEASGDPGPGGTVATSGGEPTPDDPVTTAVTTPTGGTVSIEETDDPGFPPPSGYASVGQVSVISAPDGTLEAPLLIVFRIDASLLPPGVDETNLAVFRNGVLVDACDDPELGWADPDPCVMEVVTLGDGDLEVSVLTIQASEWSLGYTLRAQSIAFPKVPVQRVGDPPVQLLATADSGLSVSYTVESGACTVDGVMLTVGPVGECVVVASQPGDTVFAPAPDKRRTVRIELRVQAITFPKVPVQSVGDPPVQLLAAADSGLPVSYTVESGACTVDGDLLAVGPVGECVVVASQPGDTTYAPATDKRRTVRVELRSQSITFPPPGGLRVGEQVELAATADSGLLVSYAVIGPCTLTGSTLHADAAGECVVTASQVGDSTYAPAKDRARTVRVTLRPQSITFPSPGGLQVGATVDLAATAGSGLAVSFAVSGPCTLTGVTLTADAHGDCVVVASQAGDATWAPAGDKTRTVKVSRQSQAITFPKVPVQHVGDPPVQLLAVADSGLPVSYSIESGACTADGDMLAVGPVGECVIVASQPGDTTYAPATDKRRTVQVR